MERQYYSCTLPLGPFSRDKLTNRSQKATLNFGINLQDLKFEFRVGHFKLYKTFRGNLTYMEENIYKKSVKILTGRNREIKLDGQSREGRDQDPRHWFNDTEMKEIEEERKKEKESKGDTQRKTIMKTQINMTTYN